MGISEERKLGIINGTIPPWFSSAGYQMIKEKYLHQPTIKDQFSLIARTAAKHIPEAQRETAYNKFFWLMWEGIMSCSTPVLANMGTDKGLPVSCSGNYIDDSISGFYEARLENAVLTKHGFGTSSYLGDVRHRGALCKTGSASGAQPLVDGFGRDMEDVAQGAQRRGAWAGYLPIHHGDFDELSNSLLAHPDGKNLGWIIDDNFIEQLKRKEQEAVRRYRKALMIKMTTGKGYFFFVDKANRHRPRMYSDRGLDIKATNLCVAPETLILTRDGYIEIQDVAGEEVDVWNGEEWSKVSVFKTGENKPLVTVNTKDGFSLDCTLYHKFYVKQGTSIVEKRTHELKAGDRLIKWDAPVIQGDRDLANAYANGFYTADGTTVEGKHRVYLYGEKQKLLKHFTPTMMPTVQEDQDRTYFYMDGLKHKYFVPSSEYSIKSRVDWLAGLLDGDGCLLTEKTYKSQTLQIASAQEGFLHNVQLMLQTLGVQSKVIHRRAAGEYPLPKNDGSDECGVFDCKEIKLLIINGVGIITLLNLGMECHRLDVKYHIPDRDASRFVTIESIVDSGRKDDTYCFTEPKRHMGVFNGILTGQCTEIMLHSSNEHTFSCILASMNVAKWETWKDTDAVYWATIFLDCVCSEFIEKASKIKYLEKVVEFTKKGRAIGLGQTGFHTLLQSKFIPFESLEAQFLNTTIAKHIWEESLKASKELSWRFGEPEWCQGYGVRNTHRIAIAPTKSTSLIMGGISEGISPDPALVYTQRTAAGEVVRIAPEFLKYLKDHGLYTSENIAEVSSNFGSCQKVDWLPNHIKEVFKTAFEIDQHVIIRYASQRQEYVDQGQSLNLFFDGRANSEYISSVHKQAFLDKNILSLYYIQSLAGVSATKGLDECVACQ